MDVPAELSHRAQLLRYRFDPLVDLTAAPLLQGLDQQIHLALDLLILQTQEHAGLDIHQVGGHGDELAGDLQVHLLPLVQIFQVLIQDQGDGDILNLNFIFSQKVEN